MQLRPSLKRDLRCTDATPLQISANWGLEGISAGSAHVRGHQRSVYAAMRFFAGDDGRLDWCAWRAPMAQNYRYSGNMNIFEAAGEFSRFSFGSRCWLPFFHCLCLFAAWPQNLFAYQDGQRRPQRPAALYANKTPSSCSSWLRRLRCIRNRSCAGSAASTVSRQVVEADRWVQANPDLRGSALGPAVDNNPGPSVKALSAFHPSLEIWIRNFLGPHLWATPTTTSSRTSWMPCK